MWLKPVVITAVVKDTGSGFLLDIAHARVAASFMDKNIRCYLESLPLAQTEQIHVSGVREKKGLLQDAHESMQDDDYAILKWVLERSSPQVVTLEYYRKKEALREQLWKLKEMVVD